MMFSGQPDEPPAAKFRAVPAGRPRRVMGIQQALEWAFGREKARLDLDVVDPESARGGAVSVEWIIAQRAILGCTVDCSSGGGGWGGSAPAHDAEVIAAFVANLDIGKGGRRMAIRIAELAAAGITPDWMPDARPRYVPAEWRMTKHGMFAKAADADDLGVEGWPSIQRRNRKGVVVKHPVRYCPVRVTPTARQIGAARREYLNWWGALLFLAADLRNCGMLDQVEITNAMPPMTPWRRGEC